MKKLLRTPWALVAALVLLTAGCIVSGQFVIVVQVDEQIDSTDETIDWVCIDLAELDEDWDEHQDDIQSIEDLKFECKIINNLGTSVTGEIWVLDTELPGSPTPQQIADNGVLFLSGIVVEGSMEREISFTDSQDFITNLDQVLAMLEDGVFYVYGIAASVPFDFTVTGIDDDEARIMVTFSAG